MFVEVNASADTYSLFASLTLFSLRICRMRVHRTVYMDALINDERTPLSIGLLMDYALILQ